MFYSSGGNPFSRELLETALGSCCCATQSCQFRSMFVDWPLPEAQSWANTRIGERAKQ